MSGYDATVDWRQCFIHNKIEAEKDIENSLIQAVKERRDYPTIEDETVKTFNRLASKYGQLMHNYSIVQMCLRLVTTVIKLEEVLPNVPVKIEEWRKVFQFPRFCDYYDKLRETFIKIGYTPAIAKILLAVYHHLKTKENDISQVETILKLINDSTPDQVSCGKQYGLSLTPFTTDLIDNLRFLPRREWSRKSVLSLVKGYGLKVEPKRVCSKCQDQDIEYMTVTCDCAQPSLELTVRKLFQLADKPFLTFDRSGLMKVLELAIIMNKKFKWDYIACSDGEALVDVNTTNLVCRWWDVNTTHLVCQWWLPVEGEPCYSRKLKRVSLNITTQEVEISQIKRFSLFD